MTYICRLQNRSGRRKQRSLSMSILLIQSSPSVASRPPRPALLSCRSTTTLYYHGWSRGAKQSLHLNLSWTTSVGYGTLLTLLCFLLTNNPCIILFRAEAATPGKNCDTWQKQTGWFRSASLHNRQSDSLWMID